MKDKQHALIEPKSLTVLDDLQIRYFDLNSQCSNAVILVHGNSLCSEVYINQLSDPSLANHYRMIAFDLAGHGRSMPFRNNETYSLTGYVDLLSHFIEALDLKSLVLVGHSLGGHICIEATPKVKNLFGLVIFQTPPINSLETICEAFTGASNGIDYKGDITSSEARQYAELLCQSKRDIIQSWVAQTDGNARHYLGQSVENGDFQDEIKLFNNLDIPKAIFHGLGDKLITYEYLFNLNLSGLWQDRIIEIPHSTHSPQWENPTAFNKELVSFLEGLY
ncbi:alpha/beta hydrolase [Ekhidna sp.]|jgi:pimeloyl-ACP methyl ester carboxylesterase|uniref:alpha/beta fold hydrolase n=1 Tax=Ekhidna sp. TaxID=2608089 RepID=UPI0032EB383B